MRGEDIPAQLCAQELHGEAGLAAVEVGSVDHQPRRLVDRDDEIVAVEDLEHGRYFRLSMRAGQFTMSLSSFFASRTPGGTITKRWPSLDMPHSR